MMEPVIQVQGISKKYRIGLKEESEDSILGLFRSLLTYPIRNLRKLRNLAKLSESDEGEDIFWALQDIGFEVNRGEIIGIVGMNGAGKSTLLKILSRITPPTTGSIQINGKVAALLEVGTGFHPEMSGRENIYLNGTLLGMSKAEIDEQFDAIVEFSGVRKFIDTPVKRYSSGMKVRLGFAVAAHLSPEILIIDEVLAVGDHEFQKKCLGRMDEVAASGRTVLFVSHNMGAVADLCHRAILLDKGRIVSSGPVNEVIRDYMYSFNRESESRLGDDSNEVVNITAAKVLDAEGKQSDRFDIHDPICIELSFELKKAVRDMDINLQLYKDNRLLLVSMDKDQLQIDERETGSYKARILFPGSRLTAGEYIMDVQFRKTSDNSHWNVYQKLLRFEVMELSENTAAKGYARKRGSLVFSPGQWEISKTD